MKFFNINGNQTVCQDLNVFIRVFDTLLFHAMARILYVTQLESSKSVLKYGSLGNINS